MEKIRRIQPLNFLVCPSSYTFNMRQRTLNPRNIICTFPSCGRTFSSKGGLTNHRRTPQTPQRDPPSLAQSLDLTSIPIWLKTLHSLSLLHLTWLKNQMQTHQNVEKRLSSTHTSTVIYLFFYRYKVLTLVRTSL